MDLNRHSVDFEIGNLQNIRVCLRGLQRPPCPSIFYDKTIRDGYAFHAGGRKELQFNIGEEKRDDVEMIRYGVAFSLKSSQTLPTHDPLLPKIVRFNEYVNSHPEDFPGFLMWHYHNEEERKDHPVGPIPDALVKEDTFIMLGRIIADDKVNILDILADFDRLLPLYVYVESVEQDLPFPTEVRLHAWMSELRREHHR